MSDDHVFLVPRAKRWPKTNAWNEGSAAKHSGMLAFTLAAIMLSANPVPARTVAIDVQAACEVDFLPKAHTVDNGGRVGEYVTLEVHFLDGSKQSIDLDYPFVYDSRSDDPFVKGNESIPALMQFPPPEKAATEPPIVQYVIAHTTKRGYTRLHACPSPSPAPTARK